MSRSFKVLCAAILATCGGCGRDMATAPVRPCTAVNATRIDTAWVETPSGEKVGIAAIAYWCDP